MNDLHNASLEILEKIGMVILEDTCFRLLEDAGADVDPTDRLVKIQGISSTRGLQRFLRVREYTMEESRNTSSRPGTDFSSEAELWARTFSTWTPASTGRRLG